MKKFYEKFGMIVCIGLKYVAFLIIAVVISLALMHNYYQYEKDEIFNEALRAFSAMYEVERDNILNDHGLTTHKEIMEAQHYQRYEI